MATRLYLSAAAETVPISPTPSADWEDTSILARVTCHTAKRSLAMTTVSFADADATDKDILFRQHISAYALNSGQTVTGAQAIKAQFLVAETGNPNNMLLTVGIRVLDSLGTTVRKVVLAPTRDDIEAALTTLTNRQFTATSAVTNYTTVAGDYLVIETGMAGDPSGPNVHDSSMRYGDASGTDLTEDDTSTTDDNPWVELSDTLSFDAPADEPGTPGSLSWLRGSGIF